VLEPAGSCTCQATSPVEALNAYSVPEAIGRNTRSLTAVAAPNAGEESFCTQRTAPVAASIATSSPVELGPSVSSVCEV